MKKMLIITNLFWIGIIFFLSCESLKKAGSSSLPGIDNVLCPGCTSFEPVENGSSPVSYGSTKGLKIGTARQMASNYITFCQPKLQPNVGGKNIDSRSAWFSLGTLKQFIFNIEKSMCNNNCNNKLELGVRIYFGQYPDLKDARIFYSSTSPTGSLTPREQALHDDLETVNKEYQKNHTLFMVPTYDQKNPLSPMGDAFHIDFDPWHMGANCLMPTDITALPDSVRSLILSPDQKQYGKGILRANVGRLTENSLLQNHGNLYPPDNSTGITFN